MTAVAVIAVIACCAPVRIDPVGLPVAGEDAEGDLPRELLNRIEIPYALDESLAAYAHQATLGTTSERSRAMALVYAIVGEQGLAIAYDALANKTAKEVFRDGVGNCMGLSNLFIGMARAVGLRVSYIEVLTIERYSEQNGMVISSGHITAVVLLGSEKMVIDFSPNPERDYVDYRIIDDREAIAHYYNNAAFLLKRQSANPSPELLGRELGLYRLALEVKPDFIRAENNLGVALKRAGRTREAEALFQKAIATDPTFGEAYANLAALQYENGQFAAAIDLLKRATKRARKSSYLHLNLGIFYFQQKSYELAVAELRKAVSEMGEIASAHYYLACSFLATGEHKKAERELRRTLELEPGHARARERLKTLSATPL